MAKEEIVNYIRDGLKNAHTLEELTRALSQNGWPEEDIKSAVLVATAPKLELGNPLPPAPPAPPDNVSSSVNNEPEIKRIIPDRYTSPLSILLSIVLFFAVVSFTGQILADITAILAPYAPITVETTVPYLKLLEEGKDVQRDSPLYQELLQNHQKKHVSHRANSIIITGIVSVIFWLLAFGIHFITGRSKKQFSVLSTPYFLVAILYLFILLGDTFSIFFATESIYAIYITLFLIAITTTGAFAFYQKHKH